MVLFDSIYSILNQYIFGSPEVLSSFQELALTEMSLAFSVLACSMPLVVIYMLLKFFVGTIARY